MSKNILGIDIGSHELRIAQYNGTSITKLVSSETPDFLVKGDVLISFDAAADFIKETLAANKIRTRNCSIILPSSLTYIRRIVMPYMEEDQILVNLPYEFHDFLNEDKSKYIYGFVVNQIVTGEDDNPEKLDVTAAAVLKDTIKDYRDMANRAGLKLVYALPAELAISNLIERNEDYEDKEYSFLDIGHNACRLDIYTGKTYETTRFIDKGLYEVDKSIAEIESVDEHVAHTYKESNHNEVTESEGSVKIYNSIANDVRKAINFYGLNNRNSNLEDMWLCGGGSAIGRLVDAIKEHVELNVHFVDELYPEITTEADNLPAYDLAIGSVIKADGINLARKEKSKIKPQLAIPLALLVVAAVGAFSKFAVLDRYEKLNEARALQNQAQSYNLELIKDTANYDEVVDRYNRYSTGWMTDIEKMSVTRKDMLNLVDTFLSKYGRILKLSSSENVLTVELSGLTLDDTSRLVSKLYDRSDIANVSVSNAKADAVSFSVTTTDEDGKETVEEITESTVTITITMSNGFEEGNK